MYNNNVITDIVIKLESLVLYIIDFWKSISFFTEKKSIWLEIYFNILEDIFLVKYIKKNKI